MMTEIVQQVEILSFNDGFNCYRSSYLIELLEHNNSMLGEILQLLKAKASMDAGKEIENENS